jgi:GNAT superfamily N-acetyltransferase
MKVDSIKNYKGEQFKIIVSEIYELTKDMEKIYPGYKDWFYNKQVEESKTKHRNIFFIRDSQNKIITVASIKTTPVEKKLCTIFVAKEHRGQGLGKMILETSSKYLKTSKPFITINEEYLPLFEPIIKKYSWELLEIVDNAYKDGMREYCYNGKLL